MGAAGVRGSKREVLKKKCPFEVFEARSCAPCGFRSPFSPDLKGVVNKAGCIGGGSSEREVGDDDAPVVTVGKKEGGEGGGRREEGMGKEGKVEFDLAENVGGGVFLSGRLGGAAVRLSCV